MLENPIGEVPCRSFMTMAATLTVLELEFELLSFLSCHGYLLRVTRPARLLFERPSMVDDRAIHDPSATWCVCLPVVTRRRCVLSNPTIQANEHLRRLVMTER